MGFLEKGGGAGVGSGGGKLMKFAFFSSFYILQCVVGVSYAMVASALWPLIALVTPDHLLGTAYGM